MCLIPCGEPQGEPLTLRVPGQVMTDQDITSGRLGEQSSAETAKLISRVLHPFVLGPVVFLYFSLTFTNSLGFGLLVWFITFLATNVSIGLYVYSMKHRGRTTSIDVPDRILRRAPFRVGIAGYALATLVLYFIDAPVVVIALMGVYTINTSIAMVINHWWKISIHGMGLGGTLVPLLYLYGGLWWFCTLLFPVMIYSRVKLKAHTPAQAISGITLAFVLTWIQFAIWI